MEISTIKHAVSNTVLNAGAGGLIGYTSVWAFTNLNPIIGLAFGAAYQVTGFILDPVLNPRNSTSISDVVNIGIKTAIAAAAVMLILGISLSLKTTLILGGTVGILAPLAFGALALALGQAGVFTWRIMSGERLSI